MFGLDSVAIFDETKRRVKGDDKVLADLKALGQLSEHRREQASLLRSRMASPFHFRRAPDTDGSRFWAVIIGINAYEKVAVLKGCVHDANLVRDYLREGLGVPEEHMQILLAPAPAESDTNILSPSRHNIIQTLLGLCNNDAIKPGDNILIYFAGHGASYKLENYYSESYAAVGAIEALCPIDRGTIDDSGHTIPDISDRELNVILSGIRDAKGDRITVILDCCFSSTATRHVGGGAVRNADPLPAGLHSMFQFAANDLGAFPKHPSISAHDWTSDMSSHVILAACKDIQQATELPRPDGTFHGAFSESLIGVLHAHEPLTFSSSLIL
ncbi:caspase domain-containing protein [Mycena sp. CBHHK59/15]|nr:caspase domain-containing protein [Mycena sp. CBHHK59/15]